MKEKPYLDLHTSIVNINILGERRREEKKVLYRIYEDVCFSFT